MREKRRGQDKRGMGEVRKRRGKKERPVDLLGHWSSDSFVTDVSKGR